jgi:hypothetical protein
MNDLTKKLQMKPGKRWLLYNAPAGYLANLEPLPEGTQTVFVPEGNFDGMQLFVKNSTELKDGLKHVSNLLTAGTVLWVIYPKKTSSIESDLNMPGSWTEREKYNLRPVTSIGIDATWTAIRLKQEGQTKVSEFCNEEIKKNEHSAFIDLEKREIDLPPDMQAVLAPSTAALNFFQSLSFTNKKEYVVWILSAKQEKTKNERLSKLPEKLLAGKKNPSEK